MLEAFPIDAVRRAEGIAAMDLPAGSLMRRAAGALAAVILNDLRERDRSPYGARVVILAGPGDNGGDALMAGARLQRRGVCVRALLTTTHTHQAALAEFLAAGGRVIDISRQPSPALSSTDPSAGPEDKPAGQRAEGSAGRSWLEARRAVAEADTVVDGLFGIGGRPGLSGPAAVITAALDPRIPVIAVDLPSGVHPQTGAVAGPHITATTTVSFGMLKPCHLLPPACHATGRVVLVDIGVDPAHLGTPAVTRVQGPDAVARWPVPRAGDDKYSRGVVGLVAGGARYSGAATLAAGGAIRTGLGMLRYVGPQAVSTLVRGRWPEAVPGTGRVQAWVLGPGVDPDTDEDQAAAIRAALAGSQPCVVDAGALQTFATALAEEQVHAPVLLTPHAGEAATLLARLTQRRITADGVRAQPVETVRELARLTGATVLLKGAVTLIATPAGDLRTQAEAPAWLATAGSGDVLAGIAGTLLASGLEPLEAAGIACWLHGTAAARASRGGPITPQDLVAELPPTIADTLRSVRH